MNEASKLQKLFLQFFKFAIVGALSFSIDYGLFLLFYKVFEINYLVSSSTSFAISLIINYILTLRFVFVTNTKRNHVREFTYYIGLNFIALGLNQLILFISVEQLAQSPLVGKIIATAVVLVYNFISRKLLIERRNTELSQVQYLTEKKTD